jgi:hypothetical protein
MKAIANSNQLKLNHPEHYEKTALVATGSKDPAWDKIARDKVEQFLCMYFQQAVRLDRIETTPNQGWTFECHHD